MVIGLSAVAPAYSLAATLRFVVAAVREKAPAMFVLAFIPRLLIASDMADANDKRAALRSAGVAVAHCPNAFLAAPQRGPRLLR